MKNLHKAFLLIALSTSTTTNAWFWANTFEDEIDKMFEEPTITIKHTQIKRHSSFDSKLHKMLQEMQDEAEKIGHMANKSIFSIRRGFDNEIKSNFAKMKVSKKNFDALFSSMEKKIKTADTASQYKIEEKIISDGKVYEIQIHLPGFKREDIQPQVDEKKDGNATQKQLYINTKKEFTKTKKDKTSFEQHSEKFKSSQIINGRKQEIQYKDGELTIAIDLPQNILQSRYDAKFENGILTITFPIDNPPQKSTTHLKVASNTESLDFK